MRSTNGDGKTAFAVEIGMKRNILGFISKRDYN